MIRKLRHWLLGENSRPKAVYSLTSPDVSRVWGIDISHWDGLVDLSVTKNAGASFVFIKGMDGTLPTKYFPENRQRAIDAGLLHAPYAWLYRDVNVSAKAQALAFANLLAQYPATLPPVIDFEWTYWGGAHSNPTYSDLDKWVTEFFRLTGIKPLLYTAPGFCQPYGAIPASLRDKFAGLWVAHYGVSSPTLPPGWSEWKYWQFSSSGDARKYAPGSTGKLELDLNYYNGGLEPPPPTGENMIYVNKVLASGLNGRSAPDSTQDNVVTTFAQNDILVCDQEVIAGGASWRRVRAAVRAGVNLSLPSGDVWASDGSAGSLQGELSSFSSGSDLGDLSVYLNLPVTLDVNGSLYKALVQNLELVKS